ncbi:MAG: lipoprotein insertase outer membrane protein LolB [Pseudomonadota bacterium]
MMAFRRDSLVRSPRGIITLLAGLLILQGCASTQTAIPVEDTTIPLETALWQDNLARLSKVDKWNLKGKMAVKTGRKGGTATLNWAYNTENQDIELYGPFGGGRVIIAANDDGALLRDTRGREIRGDTPDDVLYQRLGWQVPFNEMVYWGRGIPSDGASDIEIDSNGRLKKLKQGNWQVEYQDYRPVVALADDQPVDLILPRKLTISAIPGTMEIYDDDGKYIGDDLSVKVILKRWWDISMVDTP